MFAVDDRVGNDIKTFGIVIEMDTSQSDRANKITRGIRFIVMV